MFCFTPPFRFLFFGLLSLSASCKTVPEAAESTTPTNVIFILADDFGIVDANAYATHFTGVPADSQYYETPNIDRLLREGTAFSQAYATQLCSPTRAGILAGKFAPRLGFMTAMPLRETYYNQDMAVPENYNRHDVLDHHDDIPIERVWDNATSNSALPAEVVTLPEAMPDHQAAFLGKWHIGGFGAEGVQPEDQGFEPLAWYDAGASVYFDWQPSWNNRSKNRFPKMPQDEWQIGHTGPPLDEYLSDDLTERALQFLDGRADTTGQPFFLYLSHFAVHAPYQGLEDEVEYYRNKETRGWNGHNDPQYAALVAGLDRSVGRILNKLAATGLDDNTIVVFMSDNGGIDRKITPKGDGTDNQPFLGGKACLTEGGIRVPLIFWGQGIDSGGWSDTAVDYTDIYPTLLDLAGYDSESAIDANDLDGRTLVSLLGRPGDAYGKTARYWHYPFNVIYNSPYDDLPLTPHSAVQEGSDKLIYDWYGRLYLYDLEADPYEKNNLADSEPELRQRLFGQLTGWLEKNVDRRYWPQRNEAYDPTEESRQEPFRELITELGG
ncbi:MAG: sulfatase-like hydrolase/transferase [Lewinella sp.]